jgi:8-oxo-dGTP pyrophosphatase MutT (NUDIX family)
VKENRTQMAHRDSSPGMLTPVKTAGGPFDLPRVRVALHGAAAGALELERPRRAAVALVLSELERELSVLLVRRSEREGDPWSGHMALPGGLAQSSDVDLLQTARRETLEEVGIDLFGAELLGALDDITPMRSSELAVRPFVFWLSEAAPVELSPEIAEALWVPLAHLAEPTLRSSHEVELRGARLSVPAYVVGQRVVWGMTLRLLDDFVTRVKAGYGL